jgi:hypothetical protein
MALVEQVLKLRKYNQGDQIGNFLPISTHLEDHCDFS